MVFTFGVTSSPCDAVAAGRTGCQDAILVMERDAEAIDLQLRDIFELSALRRAARSVR